MTGYATFGELRPEPGSRVYIIPATTQGAGVPVFGSPVKGQQEQQQRIQYPPSAKQERR